MTLLNANLNHQLNVKRRVPVRLCQASGAGGAQWNSGEQVVILASVIRPPSHLALDIICTTLRKQLVFITLLLPHLLRAS